MLGVMPRLAFFALMGFLAACAPSADSGREQAAPDQGQDRETSEVARAKDACSKFNNREKMDVGISAYESCLGQRANLTHPANSELCALARSRMSGDGTCVLAE